MRFFKPIFFVLITAFIYINVAGQNMMINILTQNSGVVKIGKTIFLEVTINNTDPDTYLGIYKIQTKISVPSEIATIATTGHVLPTGWTITSNTGSTISLSNGKN